MNEQAESGQRTLTKRDLELPTPPSTEDPVGNLIPKKHGLEQDKLSDHDDEVCEPSTHRPSRKAPLTAIDRNLAADGDFLS